MIKGRVDYLAPICCDGHSARSKEYVTEVVQDIGEIQNIINLLGSIDHRNTLILDLSTPYISVKDAFAKF